MIRKLFGDAVADQKYYWHKQTELNGIPVVVSRTGWSAELGYEVYLRDASAANELWDAIMDAGEEFELRAIAPSDQRRMEAGIFNYGNDMDVTNNPFEITGLERLAELDNDNEFVSRKALEQIKADGVQQKLVGVKIDGEPLGHVAGGLLAGGRRGQETGKQVGRLVSASYSPRLDFNMGFAWVPIAAATEGTRIEITSPDGPMTATVTALPFLDPKKEIPAKG